MTLRIHGADSAALRRRVQALGLDGKVEIADALPAHQLVAALTTFDIGVILDRPVTRNNELAFPNKLFEYMMAGLAVVVPRLAALGDFVEREEIGAVYETGSPEDLGRVLDELARDPQRVAALRARARARALDCYNAEAQAPMLERAWTS